MTYDELRKKLEGIFKFEEFNRRGYIYADNGSVVGTYDNKKITLFFNVEKLIEDTEESKIWKIVGKNALNIVKDYNVNGELCDIMNVTELVSDYNDTAVVGNFDIVPVVNYRLKNRADEENPEKLVFADGGEEWVDKTYAVRGIGTAGKLDIEDRLLNININDEIVYKDLPYLDYAIPSNNVFVLNYTGVPAQNDQEEVYNYFKRRYNVYYGIGRILPRAAKVKKEVEDKKERTVFFPVNLERREKLVKELKKSEKKHK